MKPLLNFLSSFVFLNVVILVNSQSGITCIRGENAKRLNDRFVKEHNEFRSRHGVPPLEADSSLIEDSIKWSEHLTNAGMMQHSQAHDYGENIYMNSRPDPIDESEIEAVQRWYDEIKLYSFQNPQFGMDTGHFTQVVWKASRKLGCGACAGAKGTYVTCRYTPAGNFGSEFKENVLPPLTNPPHSPANPTNPSDTRTTPHIQPNKITDRDRIPEPYTKGVEESTRPSTRTQAPHTGPHTRTTTPHSRTTATSAPPSDGNYSKPLRIGLYIISAAVLLVSLLPMVMISSMIYKLVTGHRRMDNY